MQEIKDHKEKYVSTIMCGNCMYALLGDPGYPEPPGLRGKSGSGQKGNHCMYLNDVIVAIIIIFRCKWRYERS